MLDAMNLVHMNGRIYDPNLARMLSADPINSNPANLQRYNRYSYVLNNPLRFTDPTGFTEEDDDDSGMDTVPETLPNDDNSWEDEDPAKLDSV